MNQYFKGLLTLIVLPLLILLSGCNSENMFVESKESGQLEQVDTALERVDIVASPITTRGVSELTLAKGNKQPFEVVGHYSDGSSQAYTDLNVLDWHSSNEDAGRFDVSGELVGAEVGRVRNAESPVMRWM